MEELGLEVAALADHFVDWTNPAVPWFEAWTALPALAEATRTIRLSTVVTQIPLRNPAMLARQVLTLDHISNGRIELGLGTGMTIDPSYAMIGVPNWEPGERVERFGEYVELVGRLFSQEVTTYEGRYYQVDGAIMHRGRCRRRARRILVAALGPRMMRHAARYADIWNSLSFLPSFDEQLAETRARCEAIDAECAAIGRDPATLRRSYTMFDAQARSTGRRDRLLRVQGTLHRPGQPPGGAGHQRRRSLLPPRPGTACLVRDDRHRGASRARPL